MKQIVDYKLREFPQIVDQKIKFTIPKLNLQKEKEVKLFD